MATVKVINNFNQYSYYNNNTDNRNNPKLIVEDNYIKNIKAYKNINNEIKLIENKYNEENYKNYLNKIIFE